MATQPEDDPFTALFGEDLFMAMREAGLIPEFTQNVVMRLSRDEFVRLEIEVAISLEQLRELVERLGEKLDKRRG